VTVGLKVKNVKTIKSSLQVFQKEMSVASRVFYDIMVLLARLVWTTLSAMVLANLQSIQGFEHTLLL